MPLGTQWDSLRLFGLTTCIQVNAWIQEFLENWYLGRWPNHKLCLYVALPTGQQNHVCVHMEYGNVSRQRFIAIDVKLTQCEGKEDLLRRRHAQSLEVGSQNYLA